MNSMGEKSRRRDDQPMDHFKESFRTKTPRAADGVKPCRSLQLHADWDVVIYATDMQQAPPIDLQGGVQPMKTVGVGGCPSSEGLPEKFVQARGGKQMIG